VAIKNQQGVNRNATLARTGEGQDAAIAAVEPRIDAEVKETIEARRFSCPALR
jgi:hypothetical protein